MPKTYSQAVSGRTVTDQTDTNVTSKKTDVLLPDSSNQTNMLAVELICNCESVSFK